MYILTGLCLCFSRAALKRKTAVFRVGQFGFRVAIAVTSAAAWVIKFNTLVLPTKSFLASFPTNWTGLAPW